MTFYELAYRMTVREIRAAKVTAKRFSAFRYLVLFDGETRSVCTVVNALSRRHAVARAVRSVTRREVLA